MAHQLRAKPGVRERKVAEWLWAEVEKVKIGAELGDMDPLGPPVLRPSRGNIGGCIGTGPWQWQWQWQGGGGATCGGAGLPGSPISPKTGNLSVGPFVGGSSFLLTTLGFIPIAFSDSRSRDHRSILLEKMANGRVGPH